MSYENGLIPYSECFSLIIAISFLCFSFHWTHKFLLGNRSWILCAVFLVLCNDLKEHSTMNEEGEISGVSDVRSWQSFEPIINYIFLDCSIHLDWVSRWKGDITCLILHSFSISLWTEYKDRYIVDIICSSHKYSMNGIKDRNGSNIALVFIPFNCLVLNLDRRVPHNYKYIYVCRSMSLKRNYRRRGRIYLDMSSHLLEGSKESREWLNWQKKIRLYNMIYRLREKRLLFLLHFNYNT